jgi:hypothetical protein
MVRVRFIARSRAWTRFNAKIRFWVKDRVRLGLGLCLWLG